MYKHILIPVDNSEHSNRAVDLGIALAKAWGSKVTGHHVYAARLHDVRFKQMEFTLPEEFQEEKELERQRKIHDSLITMGLQLISDSYLDVMEKSCKDQGVPFERKMADGKNWEVLLQDIEASDCDLVIIGALGTGAVKHSLLGSVCERVVRRTKKDVLVVKDTRPLSEQTGPIVVGLDGSPQSFASVLAAMELRKARGLEAPVEAVAVYDPYLHYTVFNGIVDVLSEKASKVFRFKDQEQLHEDIIDTGLAKIYQSHLEVASHIAKEKGEPLKTNLKDGKAFEKVYAFVQQTAASLLVTGKVGIHNGTIDIGSNAENLLRLAPCNMLLVSRKHVPPIDVKAEASMIWTEEASKRMEKVPEQVRGIARTAVHRYAAERGHSIITNSIIDEVMAIFMPKSAGRMQELAKAAAEGALEEIRSEGAEAWVCSVCGKIVRGPRPAVCTVCSSPGDSFGLIGKKTLAALAESEGDVTGEAAFDGVEVKWTREARAMISSVKDGYIRRRARAQVEKTARVRKLTAVDTELVQEILGRDVKDPEAAQAAPHTAVENEVPSPLPVPGRWEKADPATLPAGAPSVSSFKWTDEAAARLNRVPAGFMRENTRGKIEEFAKEKGASTITLEIAEGGLARAREMMSQMISAYTAGKPAS